MEEDERDGKFYVVYLEHVTFINKTFKDKTYASRLL